MSGSAHLALLSDTAMDNSFTGDLRGGPGICGGWHLYGVCMYVFLVLGAARIAAGRAFPALLRARACKSRCKLLLLSLRFAGGAKRGQAADARGCSACTAVRARNAALVYTGV